ncbi:MAG: HAMP domain-containing sensor histidine kinase [Gammaproteobacteria bacterium]|jgi:signal transduction histidine kinase
MAPRRDPSKFLQIGFVSLLLILFVLASYWIYDHIAYTRQMRDEVAALHDAERDRALIEELNADTSARINRILWEGGFFLVVLLGGLTVMGRTIRHDAELRRRQQNFLAAVSHEFKSPLASIRLAAETLARRTDSSEIKRLGDRILADVDRLLQMVDNLLDTTRLEEGAPVLKPERIRLADAIADVVAPARARASAAGIGISTEVPEALAITADITGFQTILGNLLDNSIKACTAAEGKTIKIRASHVNGRTRITVSDDGAGFPGEDAQMIFEKFYRAGDEMRRATPGTGLGLYIVRRLCELSGARISARSDGPGKGAEFELLWPEASR